MPIVVLKLFARQGTKRRDGQTEKSVDYMLPTLGSIKTQCLAMTNIKPDNNQYKYQMIEKCIQRTHTNSNINNSTLLYKLTAIYDTLSIPFIIDSDHIKHDIVICHQNNNMAQTHCSTKPKASF